MWRKISQWMSSADESSESLWERHPLLYPAPLYQPCSFIPLFSLTPTFHFYCQLGVSLLLCHLLLPHLFTRFSTSLLPPSHRVHLHPVVLCATAVYQSPVSRWPSCCPAQQKRQITADILKGTGSNSPLWAGLEEAPFVQWLQHPWRHYRLSVLCPAKRTG